jgi:hypothetical protein
VETDSLILFVAQWNSCDFVFKCRRCDKFYSMPLMTRDWNCGNCVKFVAPHQPIPEYVLLKTEQLMKKNPSHLSEYKKYPEMDFDEIFFDDKLKCIP